MLRNNRYLYVPKVSCIKWAQNKQVCREHAIQISSKCCGWNVAFDWLTHIYFIYCFCVSFPANVSVFVKNGPLNVTFWVCCIRRPKRCTRLYVFIINFFTLHVVSNECNIHHHESTYHCICSCLYVSCWNIKIIVFNNIIQF